MIFSFKSVSVVSAEASGAFRDDEEKSVLFCFLNPPGSGNGSREDSLFSGCFLPGSRARFGLARGKNFFAGGNETFAG